MTFLLYLLCRLLHLILIYLSLPFVIVVVNIRSLERWRHKLKDRLREKKLRYVPELIFFCIVMVLVLPLYLLHLILWFPYRLLVKAEQKVKRCCDILQEKHLLKQGRFEIPQKDYIPAGAYRGSPRPEAWIRKGVRKIDAEAFMGCKNLKKVGLPPSLRSIGAAAFKDCSALEKIVIPEGVTEIRREAFMDCFSLKQVVFPSTLTEISAEAFRGCTALEEIVIPEGVTLIEKDAFRNCRSLRSVFFPLSLKQIETGAFNGCTSLSSPIVIPSAYKVDRYAFYDCPARHFYLPQIYSIGTTALPFHATLTAPPASQRYDISHRWFQYSRVSWTLKVSPARSPSSLTPCRRSAPAMPKVLPSSH
ncbi:MAG: leucine-rich repeat domain-containing protein [Oscillospiraceae bacterium]|nr:leucine-rich repeat domain-containing protein [Oscillospiraceae bacterium]